MKNEFQTEQQFLENYRAKELEQFEKPSVTVDVLIFTIKNIESENPRKLPEKRLNVLLVKRDIYPEKGKWSIPGGFVRMDETLEDAAKRTLKAKTGVENVFLEQLYTFGDINRDPRTRVVSVSYMALVRENDINVNKLNADCEWFTISKKIQKSESVHDKPFVLETVSLTNEANTMEYVSKTDTTVKCGTVGMNTQILNNGGLAFDHAKILQTGLTRIRNKLNYTTIAFSMVPSVFTLTELQMVYEEILCEKIYPTIFRRNIMPMLIDTGKLFSETPHRPAKLYRLNENWNPFY